MTPDAAPIFDAALALPQSLRANLAAKLLESLNSEFTPAQDRTPEEWIQIINDRCDAVDRGEEEMLDGEQAIAMLREIVNRAKQSP